MFDDWDPTVLLLFSVHDEVSFYPLLASVGVCSFQVLPRLVGFSGQSRWGWLSVCLAVLVCLSSRFLFFSLCFVLFCACAVSLSVCASHVDCTSRFSPHVLFCYPWLLWMLLIVVSDLFLGVTSHRPLASINLLAR